MFLSVFDIFKIGIGPSSSHTMGPMVAASRFLDELRHGKSKKPGAGRLNSIAVSLHGSLAFTGKGHATDRAVILGLLGFLPATIEQDAVEKALAEIKNKKRLSHEGLPDINFDPENGIIFDYDTTLHGHSNGMIFKAFDENRQLYMAETYYSIGGGFVVTEEELNYPQEAESDKIQYPYPFETAQQMLKMGEDAQKSIAEMKRANEEMRLSKAALNARMDEIWAVMDQSITSGLSNDGILPGGLNVKRRAKHIMEQLEVEKTLNLTQPHMVNDYLSVYAMAVNEENAVGGRVVTSPTNGAAGVVPAVMRYYRDHCIGATNEGLHQFLLTASAIGGIVKHNASISGAECGCQAEVGSASAMAAAGLCAALGGTNKQVENAAEIALEHHLGMTCDPVAGLVQVPCIERNGLGAIKAVSSASLALRGDGEHFMPLDNCIETMRQTGLDMSHKYKETSLGGLAVNVPEC